MGPLQSTPSQRQQARKQLGAWATPLDLVHAVIERSITPDWLAARSGPVRVLDPACGDGRFLRAAARRIADLGGGSELTGVDIDPASLDLMAGDVELHDVERWCADALATDWADRRFDLVVGNPPYLSQMSTRTTRGGSSRHGGGPYADAAAEFLALAVRLAETDRGRIGLVLPQSILASRDAGGVRAAVERSAAMTWSWWSPDRQFDAEVVVCALGFERTTPPTTHQAPPDPTRVAVPTASAALPTWSHVVVEHLGIPDLPELRAVGTIGDRAGANANFRDEYYGLVRAVDDHADGPPLITTGLIDPGRCHWGERPVRFAKRTFAAPRVDRELLDERMQRWASRKLVPKVLVASQTKVVEAVVDADGTWLPGVPVISVVPSPGIDPWEIGAILTSPVATVAVWHQSAGTGLSAGAVRLGPANISAIPWPAGDLGEAARSLRDGQVLACGRIVTDAFGVHADHPMVAWWAERIARRSAA